MSSNITFNGVTYSIPSDGDFNWGPDLTAYFIAIASGALQKTGGTFTLGADVDFGATYGLKSTYYKSRHANPASSGQVRLANTESISWRNNANSADLALTSNASDALLFNSKNILFSALGLIVNADVNAAAAIAYSKLNLATSIVNADIAAAAAIAYSKLNLSSSIVNADISASAGIDLSKLAALSVSKVVQTNSATGFLEASAVTNTELSYLSGVTSAVQTQINTKQTRSVLTTKGDLYVATASDTVTRQAVGSNDQAFVADSSQTNGVAYHTELDGNYLKNISLAASVASNVLTISLKTAAGNDASATDPIKIGFRSSTLTSGALSLVKTTAALSTVISSGSTAGHVSGAASVLYIYALNNAGAIEPAWSTTLFDENVLTTTTAEGGAGAADSATVMYSTTARTNVAFRLIGKMLSTQTTAGTWAAVPTNIMCGPSGKIMLNRVPNLSILTATSAVKTPTASSVFHSMTSNSVALTPGTWEILSSVLFTNGGTTPTYTTCAFGVYSANGGDNATVPTLLSATTNLALNSAYPIYPTLGLNVLIGGVSAADMVVGAQPLLVTVTAAVTLYVVSYTVQTTSANARITGYITARQIY